MKVFRILRDLENELSFTYLNQELLDEIYNQFDEMMHKFQKHLDDILEDDEFFNKD